MDAFSSDIIKVPHPKQDKRYDYLEIAA